MILFERYVYFPSPFFIQRRFSLNEWQGTSQEDIKNADLVGVHFVTRVHYLQIKLGCAECFVYDLVQFIMAQGN